MSNIVIPDGGNIGSASDTDAIAISSGGNVTLSQTLDGGAIGSAVTMSANQSCVKTAINASGDAGIYAVRAWANVDGTATSGNCTIRADAGFSSVGVSSQLFTFNFSTNMPNANYSVSSMAQRQSGDASSNCFSVLEKGTSISTSLFKLYVFDTGNNTYNPNMICVQVVR